MNKTEQQHYFWNLVLGFSAASKRAEAKRLVQTINNVHSGADMNTVITQSKLFINSLRIRALLMLLVQILIILPNLYLAYIFFSTNNSFSPTAAVFSSLSLLTMIVLFNAHIYEIRLYANATVLAYHAHMLDYLTQHHVSVRDTGEEWQCWQNNGHDDIKIASGIDQLQAVTRAFERIKPKFISNRLQA